MLKNLTSPIQIHKKKKEETKKTPEITKSTKDFHTVVGGNNGIFPCQTITHNNFLRTLYKALNG